MNIHEHFVIFCKSGDVILRTKAQRLFFEFNLLIFANKKKVDDMLLARARRMATRSRAEAACLPCKVKKAKCNDFRPCARCLNSGPRLCMDGRLDRNNSRIQLETPSLPLQDSSQSHEITDCLSTYSDGLLLVGDARHEMESIGETEMKSQEQVFPHTPNYCVNACTLEQD